MNDAAHEPAPSVADDELAKLLKELEELVASLGVPRESVLPTKTLQEISYKSGIPLRRLNALLKGAKPKADPERFVRRLNFLHETRHLDDKGNKVSLSRIVEGVAKQSAAEGGTGISKGQVSYLLNGDRGANVNHAALLERYFKVDVGFCSLTEAEALVKALKPIVDRLFMLEQATELLGEGVTSVAARGAGDLSKDPERLARILPILLDAARTRRGN